MWTGAEDATLLPPTFAPTNLGLPEAAAAAEAAEAEEEEELLDDPPAAHSCPKGR